MANKDDNRAQQGGESHGRGRLEARVAALEVQMQALVSHPHIVAMIGPKAAEQAGVATPTPDEPEPAKPEAP